MFAMVATQWAMKTLEEIHIGSMVMGCYLVSLLGEHL